MLKKITVPREFLSAQTYETGRQGDTCDKMPPLNRPVELFDLFVPSEMAGQDPAELLVLPDLPRLSSPKVFGIRGLLAKRNPNRNPTNTTRWWATKTCNADEVAQLPEAIQSGYNESFPDPKLPHRDARIEYLLRELRLCTPNLAKCVRRTTGVVRHLDIWTSSTDDDEHHQLADRVTEVCSRAGPNMRAIVAASSNRASGPVIEQISQG